MSPLKLIATFAIFLLPVIASKSQEAPAAGEPSMQTQHGQSSQSVPSDMSAQLGQEQNPSTPEYQLSELEAKALAQNPTLAQAEANVQAAEGREKQAGLWPNPTVAYFGDEIAGGRGVNGGRQGGFIEQTIVLGRKLYLAQQVAGSGAKIAALAKQEQAYRVRNAVRMAYFQTLAAQEMVALANQNVEIASQMLDTARRLQNNGARDQSEAVAAEIDLERAKLNAEIEQSHLAAQWENLRSMVGDTSLAIGRLAGKLDQELPQLDSAHVIEQLIADSPAMKMAKEDLKRAENSMTAARRQTVPDLTLRAGLEQNFETNDVTGQPFGVQGVAEARVQLPIFNRNQGNVSAARAEVQRANAESDRIGLQLRQQAAMVVEQYQSARIRVERYRNDILPRSHALYEMQKKAWAGMALSYPQVLTAQQGMFAAQAEYIRALRELRTNAVALSGFLLTDGLAAPIAGEKQ
jgi:outer membrane protein, heavy metal efflux system